MDLSKYILPTQLDNTDENQKSGNKSFQTKDLIFIDSYNDVEGLSENERIVYPTDYAVMNYAMMSDNNHGPKWRRSCPAWLRTGAPFTSFTVDILEITGAVGADSVTSACFGLCPALHLNSQAVISARNMTHEIFRISKGSGKSHTIEFGEFPKTYVGNVKNKELEELYSSGKLVSTGKTYTGGFDAYGKLISNSEFKHEGQKYVRVFISVFDGDNKLRDGTKVRDGTYRTYMWVKVEPITWKIRNWDELPKGINPSGSGKAKYIDIRTDDAITSGIPFYPNNNQDDYCSLWQNSTIRGYLNGINVNNIKTNGNINFTAPNGGDFTGKNNSWRKHLTLDWIEL